MQQFFPQLGVLGLTTAEHHRGFHLVSIPQELLGAAQAHVVVVLADVVAKLHFLDLGSVLLLAGLPFFLLLLKLELAVVHDAADGRVGLFAHQDQVQIFFFCQAQGFARAHDPQLSAVGIDKADFGEADALVDGRQLCTLLAGEAVKWTLYGQVFLSERNEQHKTHAK